MKTKTRQTKTFADGKKIVEPCYKEVRYNNSLISTEGNFAGPSSSHSFACLFPAIMRNMI